MTISTNKNKDFLYKRWRFNRFRNKYCVFSRYCWKCHYFLPVRNFQISFLFVGEQYMGNIDSEGSKLRSYFVNDLNASYEIKPKSVFKVIVLSVLVNNILIINISQTDISILMTMITLIHQQLKRLKEQGIIPSGNQFCRIDLEVLV
jgi:hypothetical protein